MITKAERTELRSIVKGQFKVLRAELDQRELEMLANLEDQIADRYAAEDEKWAVLQHEVHEAVMEANRRINDSIHDHGYQAKGTHERMWVDEPMMKQPQADRHELRRHARTRIRAQVRDARLHLDRQEADLLRTLAVGALESAEAHEFVSAIPTVGQLVPNARLAELEASLSGDDRASP